MSNIISLEDLEEDEDYQALMDDLSEGCRNFGTVIGLKVPRIHVDCYECDLSIERRVRSARSGICVCPILFSVGGCWSCKESPS